MTKIILIKDYIYRERLEKLGLTTLLEIMMRVDLSENFKIINGFLIIVDIFSVFLFKLKIYS